MSCLLSAHQERLTKQDLKRLLAEQGFSGTFTSEARFTHIGEFDCNGRQLHVFSYAWEQLKRPYHAQYRVLFVDDGGKYLGSYVVMDHPIKTGPKAIVVPSDNGRSDKIQCDAAGLPEAVLLNGSETELFK